MKMGNNGVTQKKIDLLIENLGKDLFLELMHFIFEIMTTKYEVKIFISRRFLDLYMEYSDIVHYLYGEDAEEYGRIVTNLSFVMLSREDLSKNILIVDDIVLHGSALYDVCRLLEEYNCEKEKIKIKVFLNNNEARKIESELIQDMDAEKTCGANDWRAISSNIIKSFYLTAQPYISYLPYWEISTESEEALKIDKIIKENNCENTANAVQRLYDVECCILFEEQIRTKIPKPFCSQKNMVRIYKYNQMSKIVIMPYVVLNAVNEEGIKYFCEKLVQEGVLKIDIEELRKEQLSKSKLSFLYSVLSYILSYAVGMNFLERHSITAAEINRQIEHYGFCDKISAERIDSDNIMTVFCQGEEYFMNWKRLNVSKENEDVDSTLEEACEGENKQTTRNVIHRYLKLSSKKNEELVVKSGKRMRGIEVARFEERFPETPSSEIWKNVIEIADSGKGTIAGEIITVAGENYVVSLLYTGEQNFSGNEEDLIYYIYPLMQLEVSCKNNNIKVCPKEDLAEKIFNKYNDLSYTPKDSEVKKLIDEAIYKNFGKYYLERFPAYEKDKKLREYMNIEQKLVKELMI